MLLILLGFPGKYLLSTDQTACLVPTEVCLSQSKIWLVVVSEL